MIKKVKDKEDKLAIRKEGEGFGFEPVAKIGNKIIKTIALSVMLNGNAACANESSRDDSVLNKHKIELSNLTNVENATEHSILDVSFQREADGEKNPVGVVSAKGYYGSNQMSRSNAENIVLYGLLNPEYCKIAKKFMEPGYEKALARFQAEIDSKGVDAYRVGNSAQKAAKEFIKGKEFKIIHEKLGMTEPEKFMRLQRDYACKVYARVMGSPIQEIEKALPDGAKLQDVDPMVIGMWMTAGIALGNLNGTESGVKGKSLEEINSKKYIDSFAKKYPSVFGDENGKRSVKFAKENFGQAHSVGTIREVSLLSNNPQIYNDYVDELEKKQKDAVFFAQSREELKNALPISPKDSLDFRIPYDEASINQLAQAVPSLPISVLQKVKSKGRRS